MFSQPSPAMRYAGARCLAEYYGYKIERASENLARVANKYCSCFGCQDDQCGLLESLNGIVAGGFVRDYFANKKPADMDIFFPTKFAGAAFNAAVKELQAHGWWLEKDRSSEIVKTFSMHDKTIQLVLSLWSADLSVSIIKNFDFTICSILYDPSAAAVVYHPEFFDHLSANRLICLELGRPTSSLKRMVRFIERGYHIDDENLGKLITAVRNEQDDNVSSTLAKWYSHE